MVDITTRLGKGSPLTFNEVDDNFTNLKDAVETGGTDTSALTARVNNLEAADIVIDGRLDGHDSDITALQIVDGAQNIRLDDLEAADVVSDGRLDAIEALDIVQDGRITTLESDVDTLEGSAIYYRPTKTAADTLAASLPDGATVITDEDEAATPAGVQTRRTVLSGALTAISSFLKTSMIAWKHGGTGAVWRTLYARLMDLPISVKDFGAVGDGVADDTAAIHAAISSMSSGILFLPKGVYRVTGISVNKPISLEGEGQSASYILIGPQFSPAADADAVRYTIATEARNLFIKNLTLGNFGSSAGLTGHGLNLSNAPLINFTVENCSIGPVGVGGRSIYSSSRGLGISTIHNNTLSSGIYLRVSTDALTISKNTIFGSNYCIDIDIENGSYNTIIKDNVIVGSQGGIRLVNGAQVLIQNNQFEQPSDTTNTTTESSHLFIEGDSSSYLRTARISVLDNNFGGGTNIKRDIYINYADRVTIARNRLNKGSDGHILISFNSKNTLIESNFYHLGGVAATSAADIFVADSSASTIFTASDLGSVDLGYSGGFPVPLFGKQLKWRAKGTTTATFLLSNDSGSFVQYTAGGAAAAYCNGGLYVRGASTSTKGYNFATDGSFAPETDNSQSAGTASKRFSVIYAGTGAINTSDARAKKQISQIDEAVIRAWAKVNFCQFKFSDAIEKKDDGARWHFGLIAQQVKEAFESEGLNAFDYGLLCYDEWESVDEVIDEDGLIITHAQVAGNRYGIRYEEALALECAYIRSRML